MRVILILAVLIPGFVLNGYSQKHVKDSLEVQLKIHTSVDTLRVDLLNKLSYYSYDDHEATGKYANDALSLSTKLKYGKGTATARYMLAIYNIEGGDFSSALKEATEAARVFEANGNMRGVYNSYNQIANVYQHWKEHDEALSYLNKMVKLDSIHGGLGDKGALYNNIGSLYGMKSDYKTAIKYHYQTLALWTKANNTYGMAVAKCELGQSMVKLEQYSSAEPMFKEALRDINQAGAGENVVAAAYLGLAEINAVAGKLETSEKQLNDAFDIYRKIKDVNGKLDALKVAARLYEAKGDLKKALAFREQERALSDSIFNAEKARQMAEVGAEFKVEEQQRDIKQLESQQQQQARQLTILISVLVLATVSFSIALYVIYKRRKRDRLLLENLSREYEKIKALKPKNGHAHVTPSPVVAPSIDERFLQNAIGSVEKNMSNTLFGVDELADELAVSRTQLHRRLKDLAGLSTGEFIRYLRLKRAAMLLEKKADSITQIAYEVGFSDQSYFTKAFKKQFGMTPTEYAQTSPMNA